MKWYKDDIGFNYNKPICATNGDTICILLPVIDYESRSISGFDWFNVTDGTWNSSVCW